MLPTFSSMAQSDRATELTIAGGEGFYAELATRIAELVSEHDPNLTVSAYPGETLGSIDNLRLLAEGEVDLALTQSDVASFAHSGSLRLSDEGHADESLWIPDLRLLMSLHTEVVHILLRRPLGISSIKELSEMRVLLGPQGSGSAVTAWDLLEAHGTPRFTETDRLEVRSVPERPLVEDGYDAWIVVGTPGKMERVQAILASREGYLMSLDRSTTARLMDLLPLYVATEIEPGVYSTLHRKVQSIGTRAFLVSRSTLPEHAARAIMESLWDGRGRLHELDPRLQTLGFEGAKCSIDRFEGTLTRAESEACWYRPPYHRAADDMLTWHEHAYLSMVYGLGIQPTALVSVLLLAGFLTLLTVSYRTRDAAIRILNRYPLMFVSGAMLAVLTLATVFTHSFEQSRNESFSGSFETVWSVFVFLFSGFEDRSPVTYWGRVSSVLILLFGPMIIALTTGIVVRVVQKQVSEGYVIPRSLRDHYLICNWNDRALGIILQLRDEVLDRSRETFPIVVLVPPEEAPEIRHYQRQYGAYFQDVRVIHGNPSSTRDLLRAKVLRAKAVVVLAKDDTAESDRQNLLVMAALRAVERGWQDERKGLARIGRSIGRLLTRDVKDIEPAVSPEQSGAVASDLRTPEARKGRRREIRSIVVEAISSQDQHDAEKPAAGGIAPHNLESYARREFDSRAEVLRGDLVASRFIASAALARGGLVRTYFDLLSFSEHSNEIYEVPVSQLFGRQRRSEFPMRFTSLVKELMRHPGKGLIAREHPAIPIGVVRGGNGSPKGVKKRGGVLRNRRVFLNPVRPKDQAHFMVEYGDHLFVVAYRSPRGRHRKSETDARNQRPS